MFSDKAKKTAEACRFCWMCRHLCPVGLATGREVNTPRAKGLLIAMADRGFPMDRDEAKAMYECLLCGACTNDCATGFDPLLFIREARTEAVVEGLEPRTVTAALEAIDETGNPFGASKPALDLSEYPDKAETLVLLGETARYRTPQIARALLSLLRKAGVSFAVLPDEPATGVMLFDLMGATEEARRQAETCAKAIAASGCKTVVALDSYDAAMIRHQWPLWGIACPAEPITAPTYIAGLNLTYSQVSECVTYHDPSRYARDLEEHEPARALIRATGRTMDEMFQNKRLAKCCGSAAGLLVMPEIAPHIAAGRWADAARTGAKTLVTACPQSYAALATAIPDGYRLLDLFSMLDGE